ncbi:MAG: hypothetical protein R3C02_20050 [Planctomycetaceae bacterium]
MTGRHTPTRLSHLAGHGVNHVHPLGLRRKKLCQTRTGLSLDWLIFGLFNHASRPARQRAMRTAITHHGTAEGDEDARLRPLDLLLNSPTALPVQSDRAGDDESGLPVSWTVRVLLVIITVARSSAAPADAVVLG